MLISYKGSQCEFGNPDYKNICLIDEDFLPLMEKKNSIAAKYAVRILFTSTFRLDSHHIKGAIVTPAKKSCHFVGHADDENLLFNDKIYDKKELEVFMALPTEIQCYIYECIEAGLRWGGYFEEPDVVHWDSDLYHKNQAEWEKKFLFYHNAESPTEIIKI